MNKFSQFLYSKPKPLSTETQPPPPPPSHKLKRKRINSSNNEQPHQRRRISHLSNDSIHHISSGQVIVSLKCILKELIENSLDAKPTEIKIQFFNYGKNGIQVIDNGEGIDKESWVSMGKSHSTSKIRNWDDLEKIGSLGFRGEALSSICVMSKVEIFTRTKNMDIGRVIEIFHNEKNKVKEKKARNYGTSVMVKKMFEKYPVRLKEFEKNYKKEYQKSICLINSYSLINENIKISVENLVANKRNNVFNTRGRGLKDNICIIFGIKEFKKLIEVEMVYKKSLKINGYISKMNKGDGRSTNDRQFMFFKKRPVDISVFTRVINENYRKINLHQYPVFFLNLETLNDEIKYDVNLTPDKRKIVLEKENEIAKELGEYLEKLYNPNEKVFEIRKLTQSLLKPISKPKSIKKRETFFDVNKEEDNVIIDDEEEEEEEEEEIVRKNIERKIVFENHRKQQIKERIVPQVNNLKDKMKNNKDNISHNRNDYENKRSNTRNLDEYKLSSGNGNLDEAKRAKKKKVKKKTGNYCNNIFGQFAYGNSSKKIPVKKKGLFDDDDDDDIDDSGSEEEVIKEKTRKNIRREKVKRNSFFDSDSDASSDENSGIKKREIRTTISHNQVERKTNKIIDKKKKNWQNNEIIDSQIIEDEIKDDDEIPIPRESLGKDLEIKFDKESLVSQYRALKSQNLEKKYCFREIFNGKKTGEKELGQKIKKNDFKRMEIVGQFNLGFIITKLDNDLFIFDQHACDEKYRFEYLKSNTVMKTQRMVQPKQLSISASDEITVLNHLDVFEKNGFKFSVDENAPSTKKLKLCAKPVCRDVLLDENDIHELIALLNDNPYLPCRPSKITQILASRSCRSSVMVGTELSFKKMKEIVTHLSEIEQPWNCPHGRTTINYLLSLKLK